MPPVARRPALSLKTLLCAFFINAARQQLSKAPLTPPTKVVGAIEGSFSFNSSWELLTGAVNGKITQVSSYSVAFSLHHHAIVNISLTLSQNTYVSYLALTFQDQKYVISSPQS